MITSNPPKAALGRRQFRLGSVSPLLRNVAGDRVGRLRKPLARG